jgi:penicillin-binding protein 2
VLIRAAPGSGPALPVLHSRLRWVVTAVALGLSFLVARLWQLQVVRGEQYYERARSNVLHERQLSSVRGKILDRAGRALADNRPSFNIYAVPRLLDPGTLQRLVELIGLSPRETELIQQRLALGRQRGRSRPVLILEDQNRDRAALVAQARLELPGIEVRDEPHRHYPGGKVAAHLVGYMNKLNARELGELAAQGYEADEFIGRYGLEREWEPYLRGKKGLERFMANAHGERVDDPGSEELIDGPRLVPPVPGHNVVLTIDLDLQRIAEDAFPEGSAGAAVVVEVATGRILALASVPAFDPNVMTGKLTRALEMELASDPRKPFIDKALRQHYPPGSTYKFVPGLAALEDRLVGPDDAFVCPGFHRLGQRLFHCTHTHGSMNAYQALQHSCNVYYWRLAERLGIERLAEVAFDFGFGAPTGLGLNGEVSGRVPTRGWYEQRDQFKMGYTLNAATGQGDVEVTVLQLVMAYAAIANGGALHVPQVVERVESASHEVVAQYRPRLRRRVEAAPQHLAIMREGMRRVVNETGGTAAVTARSQVVEYAGKTGTAQVRSRRESPDLSLGWHPDREHAWFAGFAPFAAPEIAVVVLVEHGGPGGKVAAPVARTIIEGYWGRVRGHQDRGEGTP